MADEIDIVQRLQDVAEIQRGTLFGSSAMPAWTHGDPAWGQTGWGEGIAALCREAREEILRLRQQVKHIE